MTEGNNLFRPTEVGAHAHAGHTHGIFHSGIGSGIVSGNFEYIYFGNQNLVP